MGRIKGWIKKYEFQDRIGYMAESLYNPSRTTGRSMVYVERKRDGWRVDTRKGFDEAGSKTSKMLPTKEAALKHARGYMKTHQPKM